MANTTIRFRFTFNRGTPKGGVIGDYSRAVNGVVEDVAVKYADGTFKQVKSQIQSRVASDIGAEISLMAGLMKRSFIGISGGKTSPNGVAQMALERAAVSPTMGIENAVRAGAGIEWPARSKDYLTWKQRMYGHSRWFLNKGSVLGNTLGKKGTWTGAYGPVKVTVTRGSGAGGEPSKIGSGASLSPQNRYQTRAGRVRYKSKEDSTFRTSVCNISVSALGRITPEMLPGLASGRMGDYSSSGALVRPLGKDVAVRLGKQPYRHTIEPFLTFFLTRAVPNALFLRMEKGLGMHLEGMRSGNRRSA